MRPDWIEIPARPTFWEKLFYPARAIVKQEAHDHAMQLVRVKFEAGAMCFGRSLDIWIGRSKCDVCEQEMLCLCSDTSDGEYGESSICRDCITYAFSKAGSNE